LTKKEYKNLTREERLKYPDWSEAVRLPSRGMNEIMEERNAENRYSGYHNIEKQ
jgi:hypothetical protein